MKKILLIMLIFFIIGCAQQTEQVEQPESTIEVNNMKITSPAFQHNGRIPAKHTCDGQEVSPPLVISDVPKNTTSLALIMDDPDVPAQVRADRMWVHWVVFNIPPTAKIEEGKQPTGVGGHSSYGRTRYGGPCPPPQYEPKQHRYFFKLYALDTMLALKEGATKSDVEKAMQGHILAKAELVGVYSRG